MERNVQKRTQKRARHCGEERPQGAVGRARSTTLKKKKKKNYPSLKAITVISATKNPQ